MRIEGRYFDYDKKNISVVIFDTDIAWRSFKPRHDGDLEDWF
jgi:hypothetical protein